MRINQNIAAMNAYRNLSVTQGQQAKSLERLSSGFRINRAADDAAGLAISEKLRGQVKGINQAVSNAQNGISLIQTAEGALNETHSILQRMRELTVSAANDTNTADDRGKIQTEMDSLAKELNRIGNTTEFNTKTLLRGNDATGTTAATGTQDLSFQIGANTGQSLSVSISDVRGGNLGVAFADNTNAAAAFDESAVGLDVSSVDATTGANTADFDAALTAIDSAIGTVSTQRSELGAVQNRLDHTINNLSVASENLAASESRIRDTDMASEMVSFTRAQILSQAGTAMLAQANQVPQGVLSLLR